MGSCFEDLGARNTDVKADWNLDTRVKNYVIFRTLEYICTLLTSSILSVSSVYF